MNLIPFSPLSASDDFSKTDKLWRELIMSSFGVPVNMLGDERMPLIEVPAEIDRLLDSTLP